MIRPLIAARLTEDEDLIEAARDRGSYQTVWLVLTLHAVSHTGHLRDSLMIGVIDTRGNTDGHNTECCIFKVRPWCFAH